jgi:hypothetical protein
MRLIRGRKRVETSDKAGLIVVTSCGYLVEDQPRGRTQLGLGIRERLSSHGVVLHRPPIVESE